MITLATLPQATAQQVYDQVKEHLLKQMKKSTGQNNTLLCMYRGASGLKCAAGCLISDDEYYPKMEEVSWDDLVTDDKVTPIHSALISELQDLHDFCSPEHWGTYLTNLAQKYNLIP